MFQAPVHTKTGLVHLDITLKTDQLDADYTLLLFYQGECPLCEDALIDLANNKSVLEPYQNMVKAWLDEDEYYTATCYGQWVKWGIFQKSCSFHQCKKGTPPMMLNLIINSFFITGDSNSLTHGQMEGQSRKN